MDTLVDTGTYLYLHTSFNAKSTSYDFIYYSDLHITYQVNPAGIWKHQHVNINDIENLPDLNIGAGGCNVQINNEPERWQRTLMHPEV